MLAKFGIKIGLTIWLIIAILLIVFGSGKAPADPHAINIWELAQKAFNILLLLDVIYYFAKGNIKGFFKDRRDSIVNELKTAKEDRQKFEEELNNIREKLNTLDREIDSIIKNARKEAEEEKRRIIEKAGKDADKIIEMTKKEIEVEFRAANAQLKSEIANLALKKSEDILKNEIKDKDRKKLLDDYISHLESIE